MVSLTFIAAVSNRFVSGAFLQFDLIDFGNKAGSANSVATNR
jgi:hypothetical protein